MPPTVTAPRPRAGEKNGGADSPRATDLDRRQGRSYSRIGPRKLLVALTGLAMTTVHRRCQGERRISLAELDRLARSPDPRINVMHPVAEALAVVQAARDALPLPELLGSIHARSLEEQRTDGAEDLTQIRLHDALVTLREKGLAALGFTDRQRVRKAVLEHRDAALKHAANLLALLADLEALSLQLETRH